MGKYILIITASVVIGVTFLFQQSQSSSVQTSEQQGERQEEILARQIARSAFNLGRSELKQSFGTWRVNREDVEYEKGTFDLMSSGPSEGPVTLTAVGTYRGTEYRIEGTVVRDVEGFTGLGVAGPLSNIKTAGTSFLISGKDTDPVEPGEDPNHGSGDGADQHGIELSDSDATDYAKEEFNDDQVVGAEGTGDIVQNDFKIDLDVLKEEIKTNAEYNDVSGDMGSKEDPAIVHVEGDVDLNGNMHGIGALYVEGDFTMRGNAQWEGIVLVSGGNASVDTEGDVGGNARIFGSFLHQNPAGSGGTLEFRGNVRVQYSSLALKVLEGVLPTVDDAVQVRVTDRRGGLPPVFE